MASATPPDHTPVNPRIPPEDSLIQYPCPFPIKVMGVHEAFVEAIVAIATEHDPPSRRTRWSAGPAAPASTSA